MLQTTIVVTYPTSKDETVMALVRKFTAELSKHKIDCKGQDIRTERAPTK